MLLTKRRLLEWTPSNNDRDSRTDLAASWRSMWIGPVLGAAVAFYLIASRPAVLGAAGPILLLWLASPAIAWWAGLPPALSAAKLTQDQIAFLGRISRKTWAFFETFVGPEDHWLPPDNYQEHPVGRVAHRTSPTNMGLSLLANLSAYDFGYMSAGQLIDRTANALLTMESLERSRGHFYNWYDTQSLKPLNPTYISTVDSGNLAGHLLTLRPGLLALGDDKILGPRWLEGLRDTLGVLVDAAGEVAVAPLVEFQKNLDSACETPPITLSTAKLCLDPLAQNASEVVRH